MTPIAVSSAQTVKLLTTEPTPLFSSLAYVSKVYYILIKQSRVQMFRRIDTAFLPVKDLDQGGVTCMT